MAFLMAIRIAHISDTHLGYRAHYRNAHDGRNQRAHDIHDAYARAIDSILANGPVDLVVHTGDVFHYSRPSWSAVVWFIAQTQRLAALGCPVIVIAGNHDTSQLRTTETVFSVLRFGLPFVTFIADTTFEVIELPNLALQIVAVPHGALGNQSISQPPVPSGFRSILLTHGLAPSMADAPRRESGEVTLEADLLAPGYDAILLGHFHKHGKVTANSWYAGATERIGWNDAQSNPGWSIVSIGDHGSVEVSRISLTARPMHEVLVARPEGLDARSVADEVLRLARASAPEGAMIRADLTGVDRSVRRSAEAMIRRDAADEFFWIHTWSREQQSLTYRDDDRSAPAEAMKSLDELFRDFCRDEIEDEAFRASFLRQGLAAIASANAELNTGDEALT
jgi:exonuclease SbcD